ncbi:MAG: hypothetical protein K0U86_16305 [Planctomycetes bacterium]|nr:hypothetical protein [Planctomycetota bacterium]MCH9726464.1 hypothetical protein [Planctomycetota bacterium]MCH9778273.1 hypothetical protein [Planctomycetota bacterium]MDF1744359.1 hypothetical protein [Gimesia sp.]
MKKLPCRLKWWILATLLIVSSDMGMIQPVSSAQISENQTVILNRDLPKYLTDRNFRRGLSKTFSASWSNVGIRSILQRVSSTQNISIILDRRIDPSLKLKLDIQNLTLEEGLQKLASLVHAKSAIVGSTIYIGPEKMVSKLETLLELKKEAFYKLANSHTNLKTRLRFLTQRKTFHYQDLDQPSEILKRISEAYQIKIKNDKLVSHDLWSSGTLSAVNVNEALSLILIQFNLTYRWEQQATQIQLIPIPDTVTIEKTYSPRGKSVAYVINDLKKTFPDLTMIPSGKSITISASKEYHDKIEQLLNPRTNSRISKPQKVDPVPIQRRKFTLRVKKIPLNAIMKKLEQSGIEFEYVESQLVSAGIDLSKQIDISVNGANAQEFFDRLFDTFDLNYQIKGTKVTLTPK